MAMAVVSGVEHNHTLGHKNKLQGELARIQNTVLVRDWQIQFGEVSLSIYIYPNCTQISNSCTAATQLVQQYTGAIGPP